MGDYESPDDLLELLQVKSSFRGLQFQRLGHLSRGGGWDRGGREGVGGECRRDSWEIGTDVEESAKSIILKSEELWFKTTNFISAFLQWFLRWDARFCKASLIGFVLKPVFYVSFWCQIKATFLQFNWERIQFLRYNCFK